MKRKMKMKIPYSRSSIHSEDFPISMLTTDVKSNFSHHSLLEIESQWHSSLDGKFSRQSFRCVDGIRILIC
jgi:hypothetical protein